MKHRNWSRKTIEEKIFDGEVAILNGMRDPSISKAIEQMGYGQEKMNQGKMLLEKVADLHVHQSFVLGKKMAVSENKKKAREAAICLYIKSVRIARIAFAGDAKAEKALRLKGRRERSYAGWLDQASAFYENMLGTPNFLEVLSKFGYTRQKLEDERALVEAATKVYWLMDKKRGDTLKISRETKAQLKELDNWMHDYIALARIALGMIRRNWKSWG